MPDPTNGGSTLLDAAAMTAGGIIKDPKLDKAGKLAKLKALLDVIDAGGTPEPDAPIPGDLAAAEEARRRRLGLPSRGSPLSEQQALDLLRGNRAGRMGMDEARRILSLPARN